MAYQITKKNRIVETLELCNTDGTVAAAATQGINSASYESAVSYDMSISRAMYGGTT